MTSKYYCSTLMQTDVLMQLRWVCAGWKSSDKAAEKHDAAVSKVPPADRIRAICALVSLGSIKPADLPPGAMRAAVASVKDGSALRTTCYADEIASYIQR